MQTRENVLDVITPIIADVLALETDEVLPQSRFFEDLGGESIDMLDLAFRLENHYGIKMPVAKMVGPEEIVTDEAGRLTPDAMAQLKSQYPYLEYSQFEANPVKSRMTETLTVNAIAGFVMSVLAGQPDRTATDNG
jgi:acyl carrier protein